MTLFPEQVESNFKFESIMWYSDFAFLAAVAIVKKEIVNKETKTLCRRDFLPFQYFVFPIHQSAGEPEVSIVAQNKDCYESGIVCMKILVIHVGLTTIYFTDNSGNPVRTIHTQSRSLFTKQAIYLRLFSFSKLYQLNISIKIQ